MQAVGDLLHRQVGRLQEHLDLQQDRPVDKLLGGAVRDRAHDGREVTGGNAEFVGIKRHFALLRTELVHEGHEPVEQFGLPRGRFGHLALHAHKTLQLVVNLHQHILQTVADDRVAENIIPVAVGISRHLKPDGSPLDDTRRGIGDRILAQGTEKGGLEPEPKRRLGKNIVRKGAERHPEVIGSLREHQHRTGQYEHQGIPFHKTSVLVYSHMGAAFAAKQNGPSLTAVRIIVEIGKIGFPDYELLFGSSNYRIYGRHMNSFFEQI